jgi:hypothetical protein
MKHFIFNLIMGSISATQPDSKQAHVNSLDDLFAQFRAEEIVTPRKTAADCATCLPPNVPTPDGCRPKLGNPPPKKT